MAKQPKLTKWFDGSKFVPYHVGEYNASVYKYESVLRWWNGSEWSESYSALWSAQSKQATRKRIDCTTLVIYWRGLAEQPKEGV